MACNGRTCSGFAEVHSSSANVQASRRLRSSPVLEMTCPPPSDGHSSATRASSKLFTCTSRRVFPAEQQLGLVGFMGCTEEHITQRAVLSERGVCCDCSEYQQLPQLMQYHGR